MKFFLFLSAATDVSSRANLRRVCAQYSIVVHSSSALTAVSHGKSIYSNSLVLKKNGQGRALECNRLKHNFAVSSAAACRLGIKKLLV